MVPVVWKSYNPDSPSRGYWDQGLVEDLLSNKLWNPTGGYSFSHYESFNLPEIDNLSGAIVVIPARSNTEYVDKLNEDLSAFSWVILILTGDEENIFPLDKIKHNNIKVYVMSPRENLDLSKYRVLGTGYPPHLKKQFINQPVPDKTLDYFFSGQATHGRRLEMQAELKKVKDDNELTAKTFYSRGFTQGLKPTNYYTYFSRAKVAPCPSGPETPDTFRLFEALELGCVPIGDTTVTKGGFTDNYWTFFFGEEPPFPIIKNYSDISGYIKDQAKMYPEVNNWVYAWWQTKKRRLAYQLRDDINTLRSSENPCNKLKDKITVVIPVSPIKSHPDTYILEETIKSVRHHLPESEIIVTFDGVRKEDEAKRANYEEFIRRMLWKFNFHYTNILPVIFNDHAHQTGMAKEILDTIETPLLLYVEQDTPLVTDELIDWDVCVDNVLISGNADLVRFHHEGVIPKEHSHMIHGLLPDSTMFMRTSQWSQRPHLATVAFYRRILETCFSDNTRSFIEDKMHSICDESFRRDGLMGWQNYRLVIYYPDGNIKRSYHTDGRAGEAKYDDTQVF